MFKLSLRTTGFTLVVLIAWMGAFLPVLAQVSPDPPDGEEAEPMPDPMTIETVVELTGELLDQFEQGKRLQEQGKSAAAVEHFNFVRDRAAGHAPTHWYRARCFVALGDDELAVQAFDDAIAHIGSESPRDRLFFERGEAQFRLGKFSDAQRDFKEAFSQRPAVAQYSYQRGLTELMLAGANVQEGDADLAGRRYQSAVGMFTTAISLQNDFADAWYQRGLAQADLGNMPAAIEDIQQAVLIEDENQRYLQRLFVAYLQMAEDSGSEDTQRIGYLQQAIDGFSRMLTLPVEKLTSAEQRNVRLARAKARIELAALVDEAERVSLYQAALAECDEVIQENPILQRAHFCRGLALRMMGRNRLAAAALSQALQLLPGDYDARLRRGILWYHLGELDLALADFALLGGARDDPQPFFWSGVAHARAGRHREAIHHYTEALLRDGDFPLAHNNRALSHLHLGQWERALADLNRVIQRDPDNADAFYRRGITLRQLGRAVEAKRSFDKASRN